MSKPWNVQTMERTVDSGWWWCISVSSSTVINIPLCVGIDGGGDCRLQEISVPLAQFCYKPRTAQWHPTPVLLPGKSHGRRSLVGCSPWGRYVGHDWATSLSLSCIGEGNGNPLQCSCLENPRDEGAWWATVYGVAESRTRLKRLSSSSSKLQLPTPHFNHQNLRVLSTPQTEKLEFLRQ